VGAGGKKKGQRNSAKKRRWGRAAPKGEPHSRRVEKNARGLRERWGEKRRKRYDQTRKSK